MEKRIVFLFALFVFGFSFAARGEVIPMYKLGGVYASEKDENIKCLEGHAGFVFSTKACHDKGATKCKSDAVCQQENGGSMYYYCSSISKTCQEQECYITMPAYDPCLPGTEHMSTCASNENRDGGHSCRVSCSWEKIKSESDPDEFDAFMKRVKLDLEVWKKPTQALSFYRALNFDKNNPHANALGVYSRRKNMFKTCHQGKNVLCEKYLHSYQKCMTCSILTGGTWGETASDDFGEYPYGFDFGTGFDTYGSSSETVNRMPFSVSFYACRRIENDVSVAEVPLIFKINDLDAENVLTSNFETVASTQQSLFVNAYKELAPLLKVPEFYSLGPTPICSYYHTERTKITAGDAFPSETAFMIYLPAQEAVSARQLMDGSREPWDLRDRDRIACCSLSTYKSKLSGGQAMKCIELDASNPDVVDM